MSGQYYNGEDDFSMAGDKWTLFSSPYVVYICFFFVSVFVIFFVFFKINFQGRVTDLNVWCKALPPSSMTWWTDGEEALVAEKPDILR